MIKNILTLSEVRYWIGVFKIELWDDKERRHHFWALIVQLIGLIIPIGAALSFILIPLGDSAGLDNKLDPIYPDTGTIINVPLSPGTTSALTICKDGIVDKATTHVDGGNTSQVSGYSAVLGPERMTYIDNPPGGKNLVVILNGNAQTVQPEVVKCLLERSK